MNVAYEQKTKIKVIQQKKQSSKLNVGEGRNKIFKFRRHHNKA